MQAVGAAQRNDGKDFGQPDNRQDHERQGLVTVVKFNQKENHAHHNGTKDEIINQMSSHQMHHGLSMSHVMMQLLRKIEHAFLGFAQRKGHEGGGD